MIPHNLLSRVLILAFVLGATTLSPALTSVAAPRILGTEAACNGSTCDGHDPASYFCNGDARTVSTKDVAGVGKVNRRYSPSCNAYWSQGERYAGRYITVWMSPNRNDTQYDGSTNAYSDMWSYGQACAEIHYWFSSDTICT